MFERQKAKRDLLLFNEKCHSLHGLTPGLTEMAPERKPIYLGEFKKMTAELKRLMDEEIAYVFKQAGKGPINRKTATEINAFVGAIKNLTDKWAGFLTT